MKKSAGRSAALTRATSLATEAVRVVVARRLRAVRFAAPRSRPDRRAPTPPAAPAPRRPATGADRPAGSGGRTRASAASSPKPGRSGTTTSASTNSPPGASTSRIRPNRPAFATPKRWCTHSALATRSNGPAGSASSMRPTRRSTRAPGNRSAATASIRSFSSIPTSTASGWRASSRRAVSPVPGPEFEDPPCARSAGARQRLLERVVRQAGRPGSRPHMTRRRSGTASGAPRSARARRRHPRARPATRRRPRSRAGRPRSRACRAARPPSITRSTAARSSAGTSGTDRGSGPPARFALDCSTGHRTEASAGTAGTRSPSVPGSLPQASARRPAGFGTSTVTAPGSSRAIAPRVRSPELGQRVQRALEIEEHHRRWLVEAPPLQQVQPLDREAVVRIAGQAVHGVGGEQRDPAVADAALERLGVASPPRRRPRARGRPGRGGSGPTNSPRASIMPATASASPTSSATSGTPALATVAIRRRIRSSPSGPPNSAIAGSYSAISGGSPEPSATYGRFARTASNGPGTPSSRSACTRTPHRAPAARRSRGRPPAPRRSRRPRPPTGRGARP